MADAEGAATPSSTTLRPTSPESEISEPETHDYAALQQLVLEINNDLPSAEGPHSDHFRPGSCLLNLHIAKYWLDQYGRNNDTEYEGPAMALYGYMLAKFGKDATKAVKTRYNDDCLSSLLFVFPHETDRDISWCTVAEHFTEMALKDLHDNNDIEGVESLMFLCKENFPYLELEFDPSAQNPLIRVNFGDHS